MKKTRFQNRPKKKSSLKRKFFAGLFFCLFVGLAYFVIWSPVLWVEKIKIQDNKKILSSDIERIVWQNFKEKLWQFVPRKSIILSPVQEIKDDILEEFSEIKDAHIYRKIPNILVVEIEEREKIGIWCKIEYEVIEIATTTEESLIKQDIKPKRKIKDCFYIDKEGVIYKESALVSGSLVLNIYSDRNQSADIRDKVVSLEIIDFILSLKQGLPLEIVNFEIVSVEDLRAMTFYGWQIYFNPSYSAESQIQILERVLEDEIKENRDSLEYIDLGIEGRAYYFIK